jgi:hypothetical protein
MMEDNLEHLFAAARRAGSEEYPTLPPGFAQSILRRHHHRVEESRAFFHTSVLSIATALVILGALLGTNVESNGSPGTEDQESTVEMAYALWDPAGN